MHLEGDSVFIRNVWTYYEPSAGVAHLDEGVIPETLTTNLTNQL